MDKVVYEEREKMMEDHLPLWSVYISAHDWANAERVCEQALVDDPSWDSGRTLLHISQLLPSLADAAPDDGVLTAIYELLGEGDFDRVLAHAVRLDPGEPDSDRWYQVAELSAGFLHFLSPPRARLKERVQTAVEQAHSLVGSLNQSEGEVSTGGALGEVADQILMAATAFTTSVTKLWEGRGLEIERAGIISEYRMLEEHTDKTVRALVEHIDDRLPDTAGSLLSALQETATEIKALLVVILTHLDEGGAHVATTDAGLDQMSDVLWGACEYDVDNLALRLLAARCAVAPPGRETDFGEWRPEGTQDEGVAGGQERLGGWNEAVASETGWVEDWETEPEQIPNIAETVPSDDLPKPEALSGWPGDSGEEQFGEGSALGGILSASLVSDEPQFPSKGGEDHSGGLPLTSLEGPTPEPVTDFETDLPDLDAPDTHTLVELLDSDDSPDTADSVADTHSTGINDWLWEDNALAETPDIADEGTAESASSSEPLVETLRLDEEKTGWEKALSAVEVPEVITENDLPDSPSTQAMNGEQSGSTDATTPAIEDSQIPTGEGFKNEAFDWYIGARSQAMGEPAIPESDETPVDGLEAQPPDEEDDGWGFASSQAELTELLAAEEDRKVSVPSPLVGDWAPQPDASSNGRKAAVGLEPPAHALVQDPNFQEGLSHFQRGDWDVALASFRALQELYPNDAELTSLLSEAELRAKVDQVRPKLSSSRLLVKARRRLGRVALVVVVAIVLFFARQFYIERVLPQQQTAEAEVRKAFLLEQGRNALAAGNYVLSLESFDELLLLMPDNDQATEGIEETQLQMSLVADYNSAVALEEEGRLEEALVVYRGLEERSANYRDVATRTKSIERMDEAEVVFQDAEEMFEAGQWEDAIQGYLQIQTLDANFLPQEVDERLFTSYLSQGRELLSGRPNNPQQVEDAVDSLSKALRIHPQEPGATAERDFARTYLAALSLYDLKRWEGAISGLQWIYDQRPDYLGGLVAEQLYHAYLAQGNVLFNDEQVGEAYEYYVWASRIGVSNVSEAERKMAEVGLLLTPTPTPTTTPTPLPSPTVTPTLPAQQPLATYRGRIAFWSNRDGKVAVWIMNPDGSNAIEYRGKEVNQEWQALWEKGSFNSEGTWRAFVDDVENNPQIFYFRNDVPETWERLFRVTDSPGAQYDPAWSPGGDRIAYVSNQTGNDEIWIINPDGTDARQLTHNTWEWDKHPSWSPDGARLTFWSNRDSGRRQIYVMQSDGRNVTNISSNESDDWDPIWIK